MSVNREKLTRDSELYQKALETKTINKMQKCSKISEIVEARHSYTFHGTAEHRVYSPRQKSRENISPSEVLKFENMNAVDLANKLGEVDRCPDDVWRASGDYHIKIEVKFRLQLPNGQEKHLVVAEESESYRGLKKLGHLYNLSKTESMVDVTVKKDEYTINTGDYVFECDEEIENNYANSGFSIRDQNNEETNKILLFLSKEDSWIEATISDPMVENNSKIVVPIQFSSYDETETVEFKFDEPEIDGEFWNFVEQLGYGDPVMMDGETVYLTHRIVADDGLVSNGIWAIESEKPSRINAKYLVQKIREIF